MSTEELTWMDLKWIMQQATSRLDCKEALSRAWLSDIIIFITLIVLQWGVEEIWNQSHLVVLNFSHLLQYTSRLVFCLLV